MKANTTEVEVVAEGKDSFLDLTDDLLRAVKDSEVTAGCVVVYCRHTTCALILNEAEDGAQEDLRRRLATLVPDHDYYAHDDFGRRKNLQEAERTNGRAHVVQMIVGGSSHAIPIAGGSPLLDAWQRLFLMERDEPKATKMLFHVLGQ